MNCSLHKRLKKEHENMTNARYGETEVYCPVMKETICLWCCLHISDIARPAVRTNVSDKFADYYHKIPTFSQRDWDNIWATCNSCQTTH